jgi:hypothetical protein
MAKPDAQTVAQMAATIASGVVMRAAISGIAQTVDVADLVKLARAIVAEVERTQPEEEKHG